MSILQAPSNQKIFMTNNSLYYNDKGKRNLNKKGFTGYCTLNYGEVIHIVNGNILSVDIVDEFIRQFSFTKNTTKYDIINSIKKIFEFKWGISFVFTAGEVRDYGLTNSPHISLYDTLIGIKYRGKVFKV